MTFSGLILLVGFTQHYNSSQSVARKTILFFSLHFSHSARFFSYGSLYDKNLLATEVHVNNVSGWTIPFNHNKSWRAAGEPPHILADFRADQISLSSSFYQEAMFPWPLPFGTLPVYLRVRVCAHTLPCPSIIVFPFRLNLPFSSGYQRPAFTVISAWLRHGSNHCRSGVSALAQDRTKTDWRGLQREVVLWQIVVLEGNSGYYNQKGGKGQ